MKKEEYAQKLFTDGYNCAQAVVGAFSDIIPLDFDTLIKLASPFGGGMGRLREVCGAVSGMFIVLGFLDGYTDSDNLTKKKEVYQKVQLLSKEFEKENGSIICRELLGLSIKNDNPEPSKRTEEYYQKRPCVEMVKSAVRILENNI